MPRDYWPWKTANTAENICLLVKSDSKNTKTERKVRSGRFYQPFGFPKVNFGLLARKQAHSPNVNWKNYFKYDTKALIKEKLAGKSFINFLSS